MVLLSRNFEPMEATAVDEVPAGRGWQYEPKWDGFRCLALRDGRRVELRSKSGQPLARYFPELVEAMRALAVERFVLDGEIVVAAGGVYSFDELLLRIHPAGSRVAALSQQSPATFIAFDLLVDSDGRRLLEMALSERRSRLELFARRHFPEGGRFTLSPKTTSAAVARRWLEGLRAGLDGVVAKRLDAEYRAGERSAMQKIKRTRTADCVVGGFRYASSGPKIVGSLLLGLYDSTGRLNHVGFTSSLRAVEKARITPILEALMRAPGFTGRAPGGPSRWSSERSSEWQPLQPKLVVEVQYDHFSEGRFRHGTKFLRWRTDKAPRKCTVDQVERSHGRPGPVKRRATLTALKGRGGRGAKKRSKKE